MFNVLNTDLNLSRSLELTTGTITILPTDRDQGNYHLKLQALGLSGNLSIKRHLAFDTWALTNAKFGSRGAANNYLMSQLPIGRNMTPSSLVD